MRSNMDVARVGWVLLLRERGLYLWQASTQCSHTSSFPTLLMQGGLYHSSSSSFLLHGSWFGQERTDPIHFY